MTARVELFVGWVVKGKKCVEDAMTMSELLACENDTKGAC